VVLNRVYNNLLLLRLRLRLPTVTNTHTHDTTPQVAVWLVEVNQRRARLVLGWMTVSRQVNHLGM